MYQEIESILQKFRPYIQSHGGDVRLAGIDGTTVTLEIEGQCVGCALADLTYGTILKGLIKEKLPAVKEVVFKSSEIKNMPGSENSTDKPASRTFGELNRSKR